MLCLCSADTVIRPCRLSFFGDSDIGAVDISAVNTAKSSVALPLPHLVRLSFFFFFLLWKGGEPFICNLVVRPNQSSQTADSIRFNRVSIQVGQFSPPPVDGARKKSAPWEERKK